ncbi:MAG: flagellar biosynthesis protein FlhF, partial [Rhodoferax sp.]|nr:flagellar biosynthesis protein FlhF [Rhodoferax sp.]
MNIPRFTAPTSRDALAKARLAFGDGTLILSNRPTASGVEVVATAEDTLAALDHSESFANRSKDQAPQRRPSPASVPESRNQVEDDAAQLAMSTLSFQDYVRERMLRRRHEAMTGRTEAAVMAEVEPPRAAPVNPRITPPLEFEPRPQVQAAPVRKSPPVLTPSHAPAMSQGIVDELHAM